MRQGESCAAPSDPLEPLGGTSNLRPVRPQPAHQNQVNRIAYHCLLQSTRNSRKLLSSFTMYLRLRSSHSVVPQIPLRVPAGAPTHESTVEHSTQIKYGELGAIEWLILFVLARIHAQAVAGVNVETFVIAQSLSLVQKELKVIHIKGTSIVSTRSLGRRLTTFCGSLTSHRRTCWH